MRPNHKGFVDKECPACNGTFSMRVSMPKKCCSVECSYKIRSRESHSSWLKDRTRVCLHCASEFPAVKGWQKVKKFCSVRCWKDYRQEHGGPRSCEIGARWVDTDGYVVIKVGMRKWRYEHRILMEKKIGRELVKGEVVHHINFVKADNRDENIVLMTDREHRMHHHELERIGMSFFIANEWNPTAEGMGC